jgi:LysR family glycine cleavage system transcriptional activator
LRTFKDLEHHSLLHMDEARDHLDWDTWLTAQGYPGLKPAASIRFDSYEQMIQAALSGQGVAMGIGRLVSGLMESGRLVAPFCKSVIGSRAYFIVRSANTRERPHVQAFVSWLIEEARMAMANDGKEAVSSPPPAAPSNGGARRARSAP